MFVQQGEILTKLKDISHKLLTTPVTFSCKINLYLNKKVEIVFKFFILIL